MAFSLFFRRLFQIDKISKYPLRRPFMTSCTISIVYPALSNLHKYTPDMLKINNCMLSTNNINYTGMRRSKIRNMPRLSSNLSSGTRTASPYWFSDPTAEFSIQVAKEGPASIPPVTIIDKFQETCAKYPDRPAMQYLKKQQDGNEGWQVITYAEYHNYARKIAKCLLATGLQRYDGVCIMGYNTPEWCAISIGAIMAGGLPTGIYATNNIKATKYIINDSGSRIVFIDDTTPILDIASELGQKDHNLRVVQYTPGPVRTPYSDMGVISWEEFLSYEETSVTEEILEERIALQRPGHCSTLVYTSGTTGPPKGVMLSHDNMVWTAGAYGRCFNFTEKDTAVSYLPLTHIAGNLVDIHVPYYYGACMYFAEPGAIKGTVTKTIRNVQPTTFFCVPRVLEKMQLTAETEVNAGRLKLEDVRDFLGFTKTHSLCFAAAPLNIEVFEFFHKAGIEILSSYGTSETSGPITYCTQEKLNYHSGGMAFPGTQIKIKNPNENGEGEIMLLSRANFMGYLNAPHKTEPVVDNDGWFLTGDLGKLDLEDFLHITGRVKELLITAGGENVAPIPIEFEVKTELPLISNCIIVGDGRHYLNMVVTLKCESDDKSVPTDQLSEEAVNICRKIGAPDVATISAASNNEVVKLYIQKGMERANMKAINNVSKIKKFSILPQDFSVATGELTPTMKLMRPVIHAKYKDIIEAFYR